MSWKEAKGTPNCFRSSTYSLALWKQNQAAPSTPQEIPNLALLRQVKGPLRPLTVGNMCDFGTLTLSREISPVIEARSDIFPLIMLAVNPFMPFSSTNPRISPLSSLAHTTKTSAIGEFVIHIFDPFKTYSSPYNLALVVIDPGSDPWLGSVNPKQPTRSPLINPGRYFSWISLEANQWMGWMTSELCTLSAERQALSTLQISLLISPQAVSETPAPPNSLSVHPNSPLSPINFITPLQNFSSLQSSSTLGKR